jgi:hypothetical protein
MGKKNAISRVDCQKKSQRAQLPTNPRRAQLRRSGQGTEYFPESEHGPDGSHRDDPAVEITSKLLQVPTLWRGAMLRLSRYRHRDGDRDGDPMIRVMISRPGCQSQS